MWPKAKRAVGDETAAAIAAAAKAGGAAAVGVFVDEDAATITRRCRQAGIPIAQLHGDPSRACLNSIPDDLQVGDRGWLHCHWATRCIGHGYMRLTPPPPRAQSVMTTHRT
jgi:phosphoribosylanthranilate isomerase